MSSNRLSDRVRRSLSGWSVRRTLSGWSPKRWFSGWSLRRRLIAGILALLAVVCLGIGAVSTVVVRQSLSNQLDQQLIAAAERAKRPAYPGPGPQPRFPSGQPAGTITAFAANGEVLTRSTGELAAGILRPPTGEETLLTEAQAQPLAGVPVDGQPHTVDLDTLGDYRVIASPVTLLSAQGQRVSATLVTGLPLGPVQDTVDSLVLFVVTLSGAALILAGIAGAFVVGVALRPLRRVVATARQVSELPLSKGEVDLSVRVPDTDPRTEVGQVGSALNRMLGHVGAALAVRHASETRVRQFVADASHELRTPLAAIRGYAELTRRERDHVPDDVAHALGRIESESSRMSTLVDDLLLLARLDSGRPLEQEPVELSGLVVDAVNDAHAAGREHRWVLDLPPSAVMVTGDAARLHQVLANLLANARVHTPPGTTVTTSLAVDGQWALITVADDGPGIPESLQPDIFERFARADTSRSRAAGSTGLGLAIVAAVVEAHDGRVEVSSEPGRTAFVVHLPNATTQPASPDSD